MVIPREGDKVRLYLQLTEADVIANGRVDKTKIDSQKLLAVRRLFSDIRQVYNALDVLGGQEVDAALHDRFSTRDRMVDNIH
jgi:hypothetical protein